MKKNRTKKLRRKQTIKKVKGGFGPEHGLPACTELALFPIIDQNILSFKRYLNSPMDCFINALQVFGLLDSLCANIMRISSAGRLSGFRKEEIEAVLILITGYNFDFTSDNFVKFENTITTIPINYGVLAGWKEPSGSHVFVIARNSIGQLFLIDPQINYFGIYENSRHLIYNPTRIFYLLLKSTEKLTQEQIRSLGFNI